MQIIEIILIAIGLSFDTFAVSISAGLTNNSIKFKQAIKVAFVFAFFQALMPFLGWLGGSQIEEFITAIDHWIAFGLLTLIGIKMVLDSFKKGEEKQFNTTKISVLIGAGIATSIDALIVGVSFAFIDFNIIHSVLIIGFTTFLVAMIGMLFGKQANNKFGKRFEILGGIILFAIGLKILIEHLIQ